MLLRRIGEDVRNDPHRRSGRVDIGVADHELLEDVVLDGPGQLLRRHALLFPATMKSAITGSTAPFMVIDTVISDKRNAVEQRAHVVDGVDGDARHADIAFDARMVAVIAAMGGEIEGDRKALLPGGQIAAVKGVRLLGRGEAGILPDGPGLLDIHGRIRAAQEWRQAGHGLQKIQARKRCLVIGGRNRNPLRRHPRLARGIFHLARRGERPLHLRKIRQSAHDAIITLRSARGRHGRILILVKIVGLDFSELLHAHHMM